MNKRDIARQFTRTKIIKTAKELFLKNGIEKTTTAYIAGQCSIAHGTVFVHFKNKDELVCEVFISLLRVSAEELESLYEKGSGFEEQIDTFFEYISRNENMFMIYFRELPRSSIPVKRSMHSFELALRNSFYLILVKEGVKEEDIAVVLNLLFAQLLYYYSFKEVLCGDKNVVEVFGTVIKNVLIQYIKGGK